MYQTYDGAGQLVGQYWYGGTAGYSESYTYDPSSGALSSMVTGTGETVQLGYDELQRLTTVGNGLYTKGYSYRDRSDTQTTTQITQVQYTGLPETLTYGYTYDALDNIATYHAPGEGTVTYTYDALGQLIRAVGDETYTYTYDSVGNILTANGHTYTYGTAGWLDRLAAFDGEPITYDAVGNPLSYYNGTRWTFTWENGRSLATATDGDTGISYAYDADGLRTAKTVDGATTYYYYADGKLLKEICGSSTLDFFYDENGYPYAMKDSSGVYYYITNLQGDVMRMVDAQGNTVASYEYDPYGNILSATGSKASTNPLRYRGYYYDEELGMYYLQSRYYDPAIGRWISADIPEAVLGDLETPAQYNLYAYCFNDPVKLADQDGYWPSWAKKLVVGTAVIAVAAVLTVATAGATPALACFAAGALKGAVVGAASGAVSGAVTGAVSHRVQTGSWKGSGKAALNGAADGYMSGAISGFVTGGLTSKACFVAGTAVLATSGSVAIETVKAGDLVWASDPQTGKTALKKVVQTFVNETQELVYVTVKGKEIVCTNEHPFYSPVKGWVAACRLRAGDILVTVNGEYVVVERIQHEILETPIAVYNFEVEGFHTYFVGDINVLVHNLCKTARVTNVSKSNSSVWKKLNNAKNGLKKSGSGKNVKYYSWDHLHDEIEVFDKWGKHLGVIDPTTGEWIKAAVKGRVIKI